MGSKLLWKPQEFNRPMRFLSETLALSHPELLSRMERIVEFLNLPPETACSVCLTSPLTNEFCTHQLFYHDSIPQHTDTNPSNYNVTVPPPSGSLKPSPIILYLIFCPPPLVSKEPNQYHCIQQPILLFQLLTDTCVYI